MKYSHLCALALTLGFLVPSPVVAQTETTVAPKAVATFRPQLSDTTSKQLIKNYLAVSGGKQAYIKLKNVIATGSIVEAGKLKSFRLIETQDGRRQLTTHGSTSAVSTRRYIHSMVCKLGISNSCQKGSIRSYSVVVTAYTLRISIG